MEKEEPITWFALEYEEKEHSVDWFWALGIIIVAGAVTSAIYANYFFAVLLVIGGTLSGVFAYRKPEMVPYELNKKGLRIGDRFYPYKSIKSFFVHDGAWTPMFFIRTDRFFMPITSMPIESHQSTEIKARMLAQKIPEEEMREHASVHIMNQLGF